MKKNKDKSKLLFQISNLTKKARENKKRIYTLFEKISFNIFEGEGVAFLGPNGSGKSSLINILSGLDEPDTGEVLYEQNNLYELLPKERAKFVRKDFGFLTNYNFLPNLTVHENINFSRSIINSDLENNVIDYFEVKDILNLKFDELNNFDKFKALCAMAFLKQPKVIFIDEFAAILEKHDKNSLFEMIINYAKNNKITLIIATDDVFIASKFDRMIRFENK